MKTITLSEFEVMAAKLAEKFVDLEKYYVEVVKWSTSDKPTFDATFYFKDYNVYGSGYTAEIALENAEKMYERLSKVQEIEVTINY